MGPRPFGRGRKMPRPYLAETLDNGAKILESRRSLEDRSGEPYRVRILERRKGMVADLFGIHFPRLIREGYDLSLVGLREGESLKRLRRMRQGRQMNPRLPEAWPLQYLTADDVWAYIVSRGLPYHSHYDRYGRAQDIRDVRFSTFFDGHFRHIGAPNVDAYFSWRYAHKG